MGTAFGDRYKSALVEGNGYYYQTLVDYIHLNPVRAGLVKPSKGESVIEYPWSSVAGGWALPTGRRPKWLAGDDVLQAFGCADTAAGRRRFVKRLDQRAVEEGMKRAGVPVLDAGVDARCSHLRRGWYWGSQEFAQRVLQLGEAVLKKKRDRGYRASRERRAHGEREAERLLAEGLQAAGLRAEILAELKGSDARKVVIGRVIREKTTVSMGWIAERLAMKSAANASQQLHRTKSRAKDLPKALRECFVLSRKDA
jgi:putative transposase